MNPCWQASKLAAVACHIVAREGCLAKQFQVFCTVSDQTTVFTQQVQLDSITANELAAGGY